MKGIVQSRFVRWMLLTGIFFLMLMSLFRLIFHQVFSQAGEIGFSRAFWMGFRFDARIVCIFLLLLLLPGLFGPFRNYSGRVQKRILLITSRLFGFLLILIYTFDFAHFAYLRQRLNASILSYAADAGISLSMVWQSYPVIKILLGWLVGFAFIFYATRFVYKISNRPPEKAGKANRIVSSVLCFLLLAVAIFGRVGQFPLRWSDAYRMNSDYKASLALNPFQSFFSSLKFRSAGFDVAKTRQYYSLLASKLGIEKPDSNALNFTRTIQVADSAIASQPNIVLVICESFSAYKSSMWGNPLNTTPYFNELSKKGVFFKNCFSPAYGTARGVWAIVTGIPDVTELKTASRNPSLVDQHTIMNDIKGYEKFYFLGGSASWANIRGVLTNNIHGLHMYEQEDYSSPKIDVWGISDKNLFLEANKVLKQQTKPFFAIIQTADNHRPYTIPEEDRKQLQLKSFSKDSLEKNGFWSNEELNAYTYMDYTYKVFMEAAAKEQYFNNTIFVFVGDHGIRGNAGDMFPKVWTDQGLTTQHVPLLFYAPSMLQPAFVERKVSQVDIMPSIASLANMPVKNTTLGRNVFSASFTADSSIAGDHTFVLDPDQSLIGLVTSKYYYQYNLRSKTEAIFPLLSNIPIAAGEPESAILNEIRNLTMGYFEASRYLLFNNKKKVVTD